MNKQYDLKVLAGKFDQRKHKIEIALVKQIMSAIIIRRDLIEALELGSIFFKWHADNVLPARMRDGNDDNLEGKIGKSLFIAMMSLMSRALDEASIGRNKIDFSKIILDAGLSDAFSLLRKFRDKELAHYEGFLHTERLHSDDRAVLVVSNEGDAWIWDVWRRYNSSGDLASQAMNVLNVITPYAEQVLRAKQENLLSRIAASPELASIVKEAWPEARFDPEEFSPGADLDGLNQPSELVKRIYS